MLQGVRYECYGGGLMSSHIRRHLPYRKTPVQVLARICRLRNRTIELFVVITVESHFARPSGTFPPACGCISASYRYGSGPLRQL